MRWFRRGEHVFELVMPRGERHDCLLVVGDRITVTNSGDPEPFCVIERVAPGRTRITFRDEDERFTEADLELLAYMVREQPLVI